MKVVMTLLVRDEADILDDHLRFHLEHGVDFVVATDHRSHDGSSEILRAHERAGHVHLIREEAEDCPQGEWVTRMARLAAADFHADWVINSDADEFWIPRDGDLGEVLAAVPERFGAIRGLARHFVLRPETGEPFSERMIVRRLPTLDTTSPYQPSLKVLHRADREVLVPNGNHDAYGPRLRLIREWFPFDVLHFPIRTREQMERKFQVWRPEVARTRVGLHAKAAARAIRSGDVASLYREFLVDDAALRTGLAEGVLAMDTRVRDALHGRAHEAAEPSASTSPAETRLLARELDLLFEADAAVKLARRVDSFATRLSRAEASPFVSVGSALQGVGGRRDSDELSLSSGR
jgi:hypothetical protein